MKCQTVFEMVTTGSRKLICVQTEPTYKRSKERRACGFRVKPGRPQLLLLQPGVHLPCTNNHVKEGRWRGGGGGGGGEGNCARECACVCARMCVHSHMCVLSVSPRVALFFFLGGGGGMGGSPFDYRQSIPQRRICSGTWSCCYTEIEAADQTCYLTQSRCTSAASLTSDVWQGRHKIAKMFVWEVWSVWDETWACHTPGGHLTASFVVLVLVCWLLKVPATRKWYLKCLCCRTEIKIYLKLRVKLAISPSHSILTPD